MMRRWGHLHSIMAGSTVGIVAAPHGWLLVASGFVVGLGVSWLVGKVRGAKRVAEQALSRPCLHCGRPVYGKASYCDQLCRRNAAREYAEKKRAQRPNDALLNPRTAPFPEEF